MSYGPQSYEGLSKHTYIAKTLTNAGGPHEEFKSIHLNRQLFEPEPLNCFSLQLHTSYNLSLSCLMFLPPVNG